MSGGEAVLIFIALVLLETAIAFLVVPALEDNAGEIRQCGYHLRDILFRLDYERVFQTEDVNDTDEDDTDEDDDEEEDLP